MSEEIPDRMPPPPTPLHATTKVPKVFSTWGTACYGIAAIASIVSVVIMGFTDWTPPWYFISATLIYVFTSTGIICLGRIDANKDAKFFIQALKRRSEDNKRSQLN